jgi:hypothetical protein
MKQSKLFLFLATLIFVNVSFCSVILEQTVIDKKALEIEKRLKQDRYIMYALTTIAVAHEIYQWVPLLKELMSLKPATDNVAENKLGFFASIKAGAQYLFCTKDGWVSLIQSGCSIGGFIIISQMGEKFIHPDTLRWYINAHAPYQLTIKLMQEQLRILQNPLTDQEQRTVSNEILRMLYNRLASQAELMCAYVMYKIKQFDAAEKIVGERAKNALFASHDNWLNRIAEQLNSVEYDFKDLELLINEYQKVVAAQVNHFALVEGETQRERSAVKRLEKRKEKELES